MTATLQNDHFPYWAAPAYLIEQREDFPGDSWKDECVGCTSKRMAVDEAEDLTDGDGNEKAYVLDDSGTIIQTIVW